MVFYGIQRYCGCWYPVLGSGLSSQPAHLPQLEVESHTTILSVSSRTTLKQTYMNQNDVAIPEASYSFPLYDGVSVVGFQCKIGAKVIVGVVKEKQQAHTEYNEAVAKGQVAGLLEQLPESSDVFTTKIGNIPAHEKVHVEITYIRELTHDAEADGVRFTIPTAIAPRYGNLSIESHQSLSETNVEYSKGISITVDVSLENGVAVRGLQSSSHPIAVTMGRTSQMDADSFENNHASATLTLGTASLDKDFVIVVLAKGQDTPRALLETHAALPNQRALMATLVPKFALPNASPEIVFVVDRSGSMGGKIHLLVQAMKVFLKSLPVGVKFNICSFGSSYSFLFQRSKTYDESSLKEALNHLETFAANYGGTEMLEPVKATVKNRFKDLPLEVMLLTDGEIWNQGTLFDCINDSVRANARFFALGIGNGASTALVEGIARAGGGFAQFVADGEKMDKRLVRMLKGALTPQISDYTIEVKYDRASQNHESMDDDFEVIESFGQSTRDIVTNLKKPATTIKKVISLFDNSTKEEPTNPPKGRYDDLPTVNAPAVLQAPHKIPGLYAFDRTTAYLLLGPNSIQASPKSVVLRGTSVCGPLELEIPVQDVGKGETIHQLAAKKAIHELEQGRGWLTELKVDGKLLSEKYEGNWDRMVEREAVRLGVKFQVGGKWCSFVAVEGDDQEWNDDATTLTDQSIKKKSATIFHQRMVSPFKGSKSGTFAAPSVFSANPQVAPLSMPMFDQQGPRSGSLFGGYGNAGFQQNIATPPAPAGKPAFDTSDRRDRALFGTSFNSSSGHNPPQNTGGLFGSSSSVSAMPVLRQEFSSNSLFGQPLQQATRITTISGQTPRSFGMAHANSVPSFCSPASNSGLFGVKTDSKIATGSSSPLPTIPPGTGLFPQRASQQSSIDPMITDSLKGGMKSLRPTRKEGHGWGGERRFSDDRRSAAPAPSQAPAMAVSPPSRVPRFFDMRQAPPPAPAPAVFEASSRIRKRVLKRECLNEEADEATQGDESEDEEMTDSYDEQHNNHNPEDNVSIMHFLIEKQKFDGGWEPSPGLLQKLGLDPKLSDQVDVGNPAKSKKEMQLTGLIVAWLKTKVPNEKDVWEMLVDKAMAWLQQGLGSGCNARDLITSAEALITA